MVFLTRRCFLWALCALPLAPFMAAAAADPLRRLRDLEKVSGGRLGLCLLDSEGKIRAGYRADERFPLCSTAKVMIVAAILKRCEQDAGLLERGIYVKVGDSIAHSPVSQRYVNGRVSVAQLCAATLQYSDNAAANLLLDVLGGPQFVTDFARGLGDSTFRLDRREPELNEARPNDPRDTTSPAAMALSLRQMCLGNTGLLPAQSALLQDWLRGNTTGDQRIRAALPAGWRAGDKTGSGHYGTTNDIALLYPPEEKPFVLTIYYTQEQKNAPTRDALLAEATRIVCAGL